MYRRLVPAAALLAALTVAANPASAQGVLMPADRNAGPVVLQSHRVQVTVTNHVAETRVEQTFRNNGPSALDAEYLFPLPKDAAIGDFTLEINGKTLKGEIAEKGEARAAFRRMMDRTGNAGLLEYMGHGLLRVNLTGLQGGQDQKVTLKYSQVLAPSGGLYRYELPLKLGAAAGSVTGDFTLGVKVVAPGPLAAVYSPSHTINVRRPDEKSAVFGFEKDKAVLDRDFALYYGLKDKEFGLNLVTHRPEAGKPGWFLCLISPATAANKTKVVNRDIVFVVDVSGSMRGRKLEQAKLSLKYCVNKLAEGDRFSLVEFDSTVRKFSEEFLPADKANTDRALAYIDGIRERGGTNINDALLAALDYKRDPARPAMIVFMTDGLPTSGERDAGRIAKNVTDKAAGVKVFTFGVGYDVNTHLLDGIAADTNASAEYVRPEEDIEVKVSQFYGKASKPVLADCKLEIAGGDVKLLETYPKRLPDMFAGGQVAVFGRYEGNGPVKVTLTGTVGGQAETFTYDAVLPATEAAGKFIEPLWAQRKIAHILDALRKQDSEELRTEVVRLSKAYGIPTPYTSFAAVESANNGAVASARRGSVVDGRAKGGPGFGGGQGGAIPPGKPGAGAPSGPLPHPDPAGRPADPSALPPPAPSAAPTTGTAAAAAPARDEAAAARNRALDALYKADNENRKKLEAGKAGEDKDRNDAKAEKERELQQALGGLRADSGKNAVQFAGYLKQLRESDAGAGQGADLRQIGEATYFRYGNLWVDDRFTGEGDLVKVKFGSDAYFKILDAKPALAEVFKLGNALILVTAPGRILVIGTDGEETLDDAKVAALFTPAPKKAEDPKATGTDAPAKAEEKK